MLPRSAYMSATIASLVLFSTPALADEPEYFEGTVTMQVEIKAFDDWLPLEDLYWWHGRQQTWTYGGGDLRINYEESEFRAFWYVSDENREYMQRICDDIVTWSDGNAELVLVESIRETNREQEIAGYTARAIEMRSKVAGGNVVTRYWYVPSIPVNPEWYSKYRAGGFNQIYQQIDSLIVGVETVSEFSSVRRFATSIEARPVSEDEVAVPDLPTQFLSIPDGAQRPPCGIP